MPTFKGITLSLISQFDILTLPEYAPHQAPLLLDLAHQDRTDTASEDSQASPRLLDASGSTISVYVPIYPGSLFWLSYKIRQNNLELSTKEVKSNEAELPKFFFFKLFLDDEDVTSWGCSAKRATSSVSGKVSFGLFETEQGDEQPTRRMLSFASSGNHEHQSIRGSAFQGRGGSRGFESEGAQSGRRSESQGLQVIAGSGDELENPAQSISILEIRVFRAKGRRRIPAKTGKFVDKWQEKHESRGDSNERMSACVKKRQCIRLRPGGQVPREHPTCFYQYALIDAVDCPFATFRYLPRHLSELEDLGVTSGTSTSHSSISIPWDEAGIEQFAAGEQRLHNHLELVRQISNLSLPPTEALVGNANEGDGPGVDSDQVKLKTSPDHDSSTWDLDGKLTTYAQQQRDERASQLQGKPLPLLPHVSNPLPSTPPSPTKRSFSLRRTLPALHSAAGDTTVSPTEIFPQATQTPNEILLDPSPRKPRKRDPLTRPLPLLSNEDSLLNLYTERSPPQEVEDSRRTTATAFDPDSPTGRGSPKRRVVAFRPPTPSPLKRGQLRPPTPPPPPPATPDRDSILEPMPIPGPSRKKALRTAITRLLDRRGSSSVSHSTSLPTPPKAKEDEDDEQGQQGSGIPLPLPISRPISRCQSRDRQISSEE